MFRKMRRFKQQTSDAEAIKVLKEAKRGVLSIVGDEGYPYGIPINYFFDEETDRIYFHGAREGHKIDAIRTNNKACFTVWNEGYQNEGEWAWNVTSVIAFGTVKPVDNDEHIEQILRRLAGKHYPTEEGIEEEMAKAFHRVQMLEMTIEHMTGKLVNES